MGYYTTYKVTSDADGDDEETFGKVLEALAEYTPDAFFGGDTIKWYEHEEHMRKLSLMYPEVSFRLDGEGEESGDVWVKWFKNGKMAEWRLVVSLPEGLEPPADIAFA